LRIILALPILVLAGCVEDFTHITRLDSRITVDGQTYVVERRITTEEILNTGRDPEYWAVVGDQRVACNSTGFSGCVPVIRRVEAQNRALAAAAN
jgi:hypothetical protein